MESPYEASRRIDREQRTGLKSSGNVGFSNAITQGFQVVNGLHEAAIYHSPEALKIATDASKAMEAANTAHINGAGHAAVVRHLGIVDGHINDLGRKLGNSNDSSNIDPAVTYASSPDGSGLAAAYVKECNY